MPFTIPELLERLREVDECPEIEAKRVATELGRSALDTLSAFVNEPGMGGGYLLFGLEGDLAVGVTRSWASPTPRSSSKRSPRSAPLRSTARSGRRYGAIVSMVERWWRRS